MTRKLGKHYSPPDMESIDALPDLPEAVLRAPHTERDPNSSGIPAVSGQVVRYLHRNVRGRPWYAHLTLAALILAAHQYDQGSVYALLSVVHSKLRAMFGTPVLSSRLPDMAAFTTLIDECMRLYLAPAFGTDSRGARIVFFGRYQTFTREELRWLRGLPLEQRALYQGWLLPPANRSLHQHKLDFRPIVQARRKRRKEDTDALMQVYPDIRSEAHLRWNWFKRFRQAFQSALLRLDKQAHPAYPTDYSYTDQAWRLHLRIWTIDSLLKRYPELMQGDRSKRKPDSTRLLELIGITEVDTDTSLEIDTTIWFTELLRNGTPKNTTPEARAWREAWGYNKSSFDNHCAGVLFDSHRETLVCRAQSVLKHELISVESMYHGLSFGMMAIDLFTTTGARLNEVMQISLSHECLVRLIQPAPLGATDPAPRLRYLLRMIPKGERKSVRHDYFIGVETKRLIASLAQMLAEHYELSEKQPLPIVRFDHLHRRAHRFKPEPYLFQLNQKQLCGPAISACVRFLLHGMVLQTASGRSVSLRPHLLRHGFATHAVQVEKIPVDIVGAWLHQKSVAVTEYYSQPTETMIADAADRYLAAIARTIDIGAALHRSPEALQQIYSDAIKKTGTLAEVVGGHCACHGLCKVQFACVGCAAKIPDPAKRDQVIHRRKWAEHEIAYHRKEGLLPELHRLEQLISAADVELREMDLIEQYRADEIRLPEKEALYDNDSTPMAERHSSTAQRAHSNAGPASHPRTKKSR